MFKFSDKMSAGAGNQGKGGADAQPERKKQSILGMA